MITTLAYADPTINLMIIVELIPFAILVLFVGLSWAAWCRVKR